MNKILKLLSFLLIILLTGCGKDKYITCRIDLKNNVDNYEQKSVYKIYYKDSYVTKIDKEDIYLSNSKEKIDYLNEINLLVLNNYKSGYTFNIDKTDNKLKITTIIDISKIDLKQLVLDKKISSDYIISNKLLKNGLIKLYESKGAHCV